MKKEDLVLMRQELHRAETQYTKEHDLPVALAKYGGRFFKIDESPGDLMDYFYCYNVVAEGPYYISLSGISVKISDYGKGGKNYFIGDRHMTHIPTKPEAWHEISRQDFIKVIDDLKKSLEVIYNF